MKRIFSTTVLFVLLVLTVVAINKLGAPQGNNTQGTTTGALRGTDTN
ncbi:MAG TPA: hypothetical protein VMY99_03480 [Nevskiaceae bacterium]|nr:hypothetical protein [Nevskiaceae bacterium]